MPNQSGPAVPDPDEFDRELRNITSGKAEPAKFTELSAAERAKQAERARQADRATRSAPPRMGWRAARKAKKLRRPVPEPGRAGNGLADASRAARRRSASGGAPRPGQRPSGQGLRNRQRLRTTAVLAAFVLLLYGLHLLGFGPPWPSFGGSGGSVSPSASPSPRSGSPTSTPGPSASDPFAGSPADQFADGAAGITPPPVHALAGYSAAQVSSAYGTATSLLAAANLDAKTLHGGAPQAFVKLLIPWQSSYVLGNLDRTGVAPNGGAESTRAWVTSFALGGAMLLDSAIKVHGSMHAMTATDRGRRVLRIRTDYLFVYAVRPITRPLTWTLVVVQVIADVDFAQWTSRGGPLQPWWLPVSRTVTTGAECDASDGFILPARSAPALANPYQLAPLPARPACRVTPQP